MVINSTNYNGIKLGSSKKGGDASFTVPEGTKYIHLHVAGWKDKTPGFNYKVGTGAAITISGITSDSGISNNSPFTFSGDPSSNDYYKVITLSSALESATAITFTSTSERVVFWGVNAEIPISSIAFSDPKTASVGVGGTVAMKPTILPSNYNETVDWESDNTGVATVSSSGVVTGVAAGTAHITAKSHGNPTTIQDVCTVTVTAAIDVTGISLNKSETTLLLGSTETLEATVTPADATIKDVTWSSSDDSKVTVDNGLITALALTDGTPVTITATSVDGSFSATCAVTVNPIPVSEVTLNKTSATLRIGKTLQLSATVSPDNATDKTIIWETSDDKVATVSESGLVTAVALGIATISAKSNANNSIKAICSIKVSDGSIELAPGEEITFNNFSGAGTNGYATKKCDLTASDGNDYEWSENRAYSNNGWQLEKSTGVVTSPTIKSDYGFKISTTTNAYTVIVSDGTNEGTNTLTTSKTNTTITISSTTSNYAKISSITITALKQPITTDVTITDPGTLAKGAIGTFAATSTDAAACTKAWTSSDASVIEVNATTGAYEAKGHGTAKITLTTTPDDAIAYEAVTAELNVSVTEPVEVTASDVTMTYGDAAKAIGATTPTGYAGTLTYASGNTNIATVDASGNVTAVATGSTTITISAPADATNLYTVAEKVINVTVSAPTGGTTAKSTTPVEIAKQTLLSNNLPTSWTGDGAIWSGNSSYGAVTATGTIGNSYDLITESIDLASNYTAASVTFQHTGNQTFGNGRTEACKLFVKDGNTETQLTINTMFAGNNWTYVTNTTDLTAYIGKSIQLVFRYTPSSGNQGKWEVKNFAVNATPASVVTATLNTSGYATYCSEYPLDFSDAESYTAWYVSDIDADNKITFSQITGSIKGGQGILLKGTANANVTITSINSDNVLSDNKLEGTLAPKFIDNDNYYGLSGASFVKVNSGTVPAGKALIPASLVDENKLSDGARLTFIFEDATGISDMKREIITNYRYYDMQGRPVAQPSKGLYLINGKKVVVK